MDELEPIDAEALMERLRENIKRRRRETEGPVSSSDAATGPAIGADLAVLRSSYDVTDVHLTSHRTVLGAVVVLAKRTLQRLLTPVLARQVAYNAANTRIVDALGERLRTVDRSDAQVHEALVEFAGQQERLIAENQIRAAEHAELRERLDAVTAQQAQLGEGLHAAAAGHARLESLVTQQRQTTQTVAALIREQAESRDALRTTREQVARAERKLRRILHALTEGAPETAVTLPPRPAAAARLREADFDYAGFEEHFRGSEDSIKRRQARYVEHFRGRDTVVDIGCGRGEFLEVLRDAGIDAVGVDTDLDMILYCREKSLKAIQQDAAAYLETLPDESLGGIFTAQLVEHLESADITRLVRLGYRKLRPRGVLVIETLNPECLFVLYRWFWIDLTHTRLIHPQTLTFLLESAGFREVGCEFLPPGDTPLTIPALELPGQAVPELGRFNAATDYLNKLLYGSSDYAVVGTK